jgi:hypothetical protein
MSQPEIAGEQEVDFGRYWLAIIRRWWLPVGALVLGGIVGVLVQSGGARPYKATVTVYLGQPYAPDSTTAIQSLPTRLGFIQETATARAVLRKAAAAADIPLGRLQGNVSASAIGVTSGSRQVSSPLVSISVTNPSAKKAVVALTSIATSVVNDFSTYVDTKLATYKARLSRTVRELERVEQQIAFAEEQQAKVLADRSISSVERLIVLANFNEVLQYNTSRQANLESAQLSLGDSVALAQQVERARIVQEPVASRVAAASKRSGGLVGLVIGAVLGLLAAILWEPGTQLIRRARTAS